MKVDPQDPYTIVGTYLRRVLALPQSRTEVTRASGPFAVMVVFFLWKQMDHAEGLLRLGTHRDTALVARSMLEGLYQLKWAAQDPDARGDRWRRFAWVHDWRLMQKRLRAGLTVSAAERRRIDAGVKQYAADFMTKKAIKKGRAPPADPYVAHWSGVSVAQLSAAVQGTPLYEWPYAHFSDWHHWSPGGVLRTAQRRGNRVRAFQQPQPRDAVATYAVAFQCLYETVALADSTLTLGLDQQLQSLLVDYLRDMGPLHDAARVRARQSDA